MRKLLLLSLIWPSLAFADDVQIGKTTQKNGMEINAVYIQPVKMEPEHHTALERPDIHLEADIAALKDNAHGFAEGNWMPYMNVSYTLTKNESDWKKEGVLMPMVASDGPHYGDNVALDGAGKYRLTIVFEPPSGHQSMRHVDKETGVSPWWQPFELQYDFVWIGSTGKKGGY